MIRVVRAYLGLGGNLGDRLVTLAAALTVVDALPSTAVVAVSRVFESESWPSPDQPPYANAVAVVETALEADVLLGRLKEIEREFGREGSEPNAPRPVDIDIVLFGDEEWASDALTIPHPRFAEREFVVVPLLEVDPFAELPDGDRVSTVGATEGRITAVLGVLPGFEGVTRMDAEEERDEAVDEHRATGRHDGEEWVVVAESDRESRLPRTPDVGLIFKRTVLEAEGIPHAWDPYPPGEASNPYGLEPVFRLRVPASLAERARRVLAEAEAAPLAPEDEGEP